MPPLRRYDDGAVRLARVGLDQVGQRVEASGEPLAPDALLLGRRREPCGHHNPVG